MSDSGDTGPALNGVLEFTYEFVKRMRNRADLMSPPSIRQTNAIPKLLSARYFRNGKISHLDLVEVAVFTTNPEDQGIGREVAEDIILGASSRKKKPETPVQYTPPRPVDADPLEAMIAKIKRERDSSRKLQDEEIEAGSEYLDNLLTRKDAPEIETALQYLTEGDIILKGLKNDDELREAFRLGNPGLQVLTSGGKKMKFTTTSLLLTIAAMLLPAPEGIPEKIPQDQQNAIASS